MSMKTKIINPTKTGQHYSWIPRHGMGLGAGESIIISGQLQPKKRRQKIYMEADIKEGRVQLVLIDGCDSPADKEIPVNKPEKKAGGKKAEKAQEAVVKAVKGTADATIEVPEVDTPDTVIPGVTAVDEDEKDEIYDERGKLIEEEEPVIVSNIHDIDEDDILSKEAAKKEADVLSADELAGMTTKEVKAYAKELGVSFHKTASKKQVIEAISEKN